MLVIPFWKSGVYIIFVTRLPVFYLGMLFASGAEEERVVRPWQMVLGTVVMGLGIWFLKYAFREIPDTLWRYGVAWVPFVVIAPPMCVLLSGGAELLERVPGGKSVVRFLSWVGGLSFEIYLLHISIVEILEKRLAEHSLGDSRFLVWAAAVAVMMVLCVLLRRISQLLVRRIRKK